MKRIAAAFLLGGVALAAAESAEWAPTVTTAVTWSSNATNADRASDVIGALQVRADVEAFAQRVALGHDDTLLFSAAAGAEAWPRFDELNRFTLGPRLAWQHKFGLGPLAPVVRVEFSVDGLAARDQDRSGWAHRTRLVWQRRFDEATLLTVSFERAEQYVHEDVYNRIGSEAAVAVARDLTENWSLAATARWRHGDMLSYAAPPRPDLVGLAKRRTDSDTFRLDQVVYSIDARSLGGGLDLTRALDERSAVTLGYELRVTDRHPLRYVNHLVSVALTRQF